MNGKILMGFGVAVLVWALVSALNAQLLLAAVLGVAGVGLIGYGAATMKGRK